VLVAAGVVGVVWLGFEVVTLQREVSRLRAEVRVRAAVPRESAQEPDARLEPESADVSSVIEIPAALPNDWVRDEEFAAARDRIATLEARMASLEDALATGPVVTFDRFPVLDPSQFPAGSPVYSPTTQGNNPDAPSWGIQQALGPPDTLTQGDKATAWASKEPDAGHEWLEVDFEAAVAADAILIRENFNPGAVTRVEVIGGDGRRRTVWKGRDPTTNEDPVFRIPVSLAYPIGTVRITLDTTLVSGWNEIDAIGLEAAGTTHWAVAADASSTYADRTAAVTSD
ncbi:MAG: discoidin domain-containing protein, partial [Planctomycetota bacterium]